MKFKEFRGESVRTSLQIFVVILVVIIAIAIVIIPGILSYYNAKKMLVNDFDYTITFSGVYSDKSIMKKLETQSGESLQLLLDGRVLFGKLSFWIENEAGKTVFFRSGKRLSFNDIIAVDGENITVHVELNKASIVLFAAGVIFEKR